METIFPVFNVLVKEEVVRCYRVMNLDLCSMKQHKTLITRSHITFKDKASYQIAIETSMPILPYCISELNSNFCSILQKYQIY